MEEVRLNGPITQITSPSGRWVKFAYDTANPPKVTGIEDNLGRRVGYEYDTGSRLAKVTNTEGGTTLYGWAGNKLKTITDPRGTVYLTNEYDAAGRVAKQTAADGGITEFAYTESGGAITETRMTDPRRFVHRYTFNAKGSVLTETKAFGTPIAATTTTEYDSSGARRTASTDPLGRRTAYEYNDLGQVSKITQLDGTPDAKARRFEYNGPHGELTKSTDEYGKDTVYELDARGAVKSVTDASGRKTSYGVDGAGLITSVTDPDNKTSTVEYAGADPVRSKDELGRTSTSGFDAVGRKVVTSDARGAVTETRYSGADHVLSVVDPLGHTVSYEYDANGNRTKVVDGRGGATVFTYDVMDRVRTVTDPLGAADLTEYDRNGNLVKYTSRRGVVTESDYDELDRRTETRYGAEGTTKYGYDAADRLVRTEDTAAGVSTLDYDGLDRVKKESGPHGSVGYTYSATERDRTATVAGHSPIRHVYSATGELSEIQHGGTVVDGVSRDLVGRPSTVGLAGGVHQTYTYDATGSVKTITYRNGSTVLGSLNYDYDRSGNPSRTDGSFSRSVLPEAFGPATYDAANRLRTAGSATAGYDADGNLLFDGTTSYTWNSRGQLAGLSAPGKSASFTYAADGRRIGRTIDGTTTNYLYDGDNPLQEKVDGTTSATVTSAGTDAFTIRESGGGTRRHLVDALGSTVALVDGTGVGAAYSYEPFGRTYKSGDDVGNSFEFTNRENDGTGLHFHRARYYSPALQRFISEDPIGFDGGINLHAYVGNKPTELTDPAGEDAKQIHYRGRYNIDLWEKNKPKLPKNWDAHHRIPQEYRNHPEFKDFDFDAPSNILGVPGSRVPGPVTNVHQHITNAWRDFRVQNPNATRAEIEAFAERVDAQFEGFWWYR
ncbi:RHS repeat-associated core domain-containing protein [Saccharothrix variisporea]|uniref:RHS repeat-associated core domain-containing protein n=1 Tax=Saccharothrix variisporea TaxID=543527 RepID=UPI000EB12794|nr:RHS repeat-associated core domain-containing protein [Saccharothrix variisporea]